jgi:outer membrane protein assembly factor BamD
MTYIVNSLAQHEVHVARYYSQRGAHVAAISRAQSALTDYSGAPASEEALHILVLSYEALGLPQLRDDARRVLAQNFPESIYLDDRKLRAKDEPWWKLW